MSDFRELTFSPLSPDVDGDDIEIFTFQSCPASQDIENDPDPAQAHPQSSQLAQLSRIPQPHELEGGLSSVWGASFNFVNSIVGAGIIGIPYAIQQCGFLPGLLMLSLVAYLIYRSVIMLVECGIKYNKYDLEDLSEHILGPFGFFLATGSMFLFAYGGQVAYLVIIGDTFPLVSDYLFGPSFLSTRQTSVLFFSSLVILPLSLLRDLSSLACTSGVSIASDVILVLIILLAAPHASQDQARHFEAKDLSSLGLTLFAGVGTMSFAFVCQHNSFLVFRSLHTPSLANWRKVARNSISFAYGLCLVLGLIGFFAFYPYVEGDLLNNFPPASKGVTIARALLGLSMLFTYPMEMYVARHCLQVMAGRWREKGGFLPLLPPVLSWRERGGQRRGGEGEREEVISFDEESEAFWHSPPSPSSPSSPFSLPAPSFLSSFSIWLSSFLPSTSRPSLPAHLSFSSGPARKLSARIVLSPLVDGGFEEVALDSTHGSNSSPAFSSSPHSPAAAPVAAPAPALAPSSPRRRRGGGESLSYPPAPPLSLPSAPTPTLSALAPKIDEEKRGERGKEERAEREERDGEREEGEGREREKGVEEKEEERREHGGEKGRVGLEGHVLITLLLWGSTTGLAMQAEGLGLVSSLTGVAAASTLGYTLPALLYLRSRNNSRNFSLSSLCSKDCFLPVFMVCFGLAALLIGVVTVLWSV